MFLFPKTTSFSRYLIPTRFCLVFLRFQFCCLVLGPVRWIPPLVRPSVIEFQVCSKFVEWASSEESIVAKEGGGRLGALQPERSRANIFPSPSLILLGEDSGFPELSLGRPCEQLHRVLSVRSIWREFVEGVCKGEWRSASQVQGSTCRDD
ncbi:hypothetical protein V6N13_111349 [Hibiscus sabdariffa]|uniref:Secreted protein n=1 Tax=Hibiscus sabdariffa TaxID=183260 RepID=A0ABR2TKJ6_9ROSI